MAFFIWLSSIKEVGCFEVADDHLVRNVSNEELLKNDLQNKALILEDMYDADHVLLASLGPKAGISTFLAKNFNICIDQI